MIGTVQPDLEGVPGFDVRSSFACFFCQRCHNSSGLILGVGYGKGEQASLVLWMELLSGGGDY